MIREEEKLTRHINKYENKNIIHQFLINRFFDNFAELLTQRRYKNILEIGCAEGYLLDKLLQRGIKIDSYCGIDIREESITEANKTFPQFNFKVQDFNDLSPGHEKFDLIICSQVLEHLTNPQECLNKIKQISAPDTQIILSVPWEPWFRLGNLARGRDISRLGNHPEHIQQWTAKGFKNYVNATLKVREFKTSFPFTLGSFTV